MRQETVYESDDKEVRARFGATNPSPLARLATLDGYSIAAGDPDIRGWHVRTADGWKLGEVEELIVDTTARHRHAPVGPRTVAVSRIVRP